MADVDEVGDVEVAVGGWVVSVTANVRAAKFAHRHLFLAEPDAGFVAASLSVRTLANVQCAFDECRFLEDGRGCRVHSRAMVLGVSKLLVGGEVLGELTTRGVLFVRLSPKGVLAPTEWSSLPHWFSERPDLVEWARAEERQRRVDDDVRRWEAKV